MALPPADLVAALNTALIVASGAFLIAGYTLIRRHNVRWHRRAMLTAATFAGLFLVVYVTRYALYAPRIFAGQGAVRAVYLSILISHTLLAVILGPLVLLTLQRALRGEYRRHRRLARFALPIWLYVALTGWAIYTMLQAF